MDVGTAAAAVGLAASTSALVALFWKAWAVLNKKVFRPVGQIWDAFFGDPGDPVLERPAVPGLLARVGTIERTIPVLVAQVAHLVDEASPNHGSSTYDRVKRIDEALTEQANA